MSPAAVPIPERMELPITGMTCASCAARVEKGLNRLEGVDASVNYATETATVSFDAARSQPESPRRGRRAGPATARACPSAAVGGGAPGRPDPTAALRRRVVVSAALSLPVLLLSMIPALQFDNWQWLALQLATPVVLWGAWPFHRAAWVNLRHGAATMDTLISVGTLAAWGWSLVALLFLGAGRPRDADGLRPGDRAGGRRRAHLPRGGRGRDHLPPGRPLLRGARQAAGGGRASLRCSSWAPRRHRFSTRMAPSDAYRSRSSRWATASSCAPASGSRPTA